MNQIEQTITSVEVAGMVNKRHTDLIRDIRRYSEQLAESKIALSDFFTESTYKDSTGRALPCYNVTKKQYTEGYENRQQRRSYSKKYNKNRNYNKFHGV